MSSTQLPVFTDTLTRRLYANDASMYEELPEGVCFPKNTDDLVSLVKTALSQRKSITARAAGTSLAGQVTGGGIIADTSRFMNQIIELDADKKRASVQPGVIRDSLNREAKKFGLLFGPDTSTTNRCMIGGMIGNNSAGSYSIKYGSTREHIISIDAVLSDGSQVRFEPLTNDQLDQKMSLETLEGYIYREMIALLKKHKEAIFEAFPHPDVKRRNTGYALDKLCEMQPLSPGGRPFNMCELLCGSEGTLALTASAVVNLERIDPHKTLLIPHFKSLDEAMRATVIAVKHTPAAVELIDYHILNATKGNLEQERNRFFLNGDPDCLLIIEFEGASNAEVKTQAENLRADLVESGLGYAFPVFNSDEEMRRVWDLRKAGLGLLMGLSDDAKTPSFAEDTAVRVEDLPAYIKDFQQLLEKYQTSCVFYAHASVGELHLRPVFDLNKRSDIERMKDMMTDVARLVKSYRGSLSGEHGDGRNRAPYIELVIGKEMTKVLGEVKQIWDPSNVFNPGKIVHALPMDSYLRHNPEKSVQAVETTFHWRKEKGFHAALELCNGAGVCRKRAESGGTMCPSYMATLDEKDSTRGRANIFRQLFTEKGADAFNSEDVKEALKLCLSCKACKSECPANVDMARMKSEFLQHWHDRNGVSFQTAFWSNPFPFLKLGALFPTLSNFIAASNPGRYVMEQLIGLHPSRPLPEFAPKPFSSNLPELTQSGPQTGREVLLLIDPFTDLHQPQVAVSAWKLLDKLGYRLLKPIIATTGRTLISGGQPAKAKKIVQSLLPLLESYARRGVAIVGIEPSELLTLRDEFPDLCEENQRNTASIVASSSFLIEEIIAQNTEESVVHFSSNRKKERVFVHGHCYVKALTGMNDLLNSLRMFGYEPILLDTGCCGMAGSFGYRKETYDVSQQIGKQRLFPQLNDLPKDALICTHGFSCHHQIKDGTGKRSYHPAEMLSRSYLYNP